MTDITLFDEIEILTEVEALAEDMAAPPLCLVHYFGAGADPPKRSPRPPEVGLAGRIAERRGNLIILEFAPPPRPRRTKPGREKLFAKIADALFLLLLLICVIGCAAAFRF